MGAFPGHGEERSFEVRAQNIRAVRHHVVDRLQVTADDVDGIGDEAQDLSRRSVRHVSGSGGRDPLLAVIERASPCAVRVDVDVSGRHHHSISVNNMILLDVDQPAGRFEGRFGASRFDYRPSVGNEPTVFRHSTRVDDCGAVHREWHDLLEERVVDSFRLSHTIRLHAVVS